jgi:hypothetical protein
MGMIPPTAYHILTTQHPPAPVSLWDSRPCHIDPGAQTCNGILPYAPYNFTAVTPGKIPGESACIDQKSRQYQAPLVNRGDQLGTITLWWLPSCQSAFAIASAVTDAGDTPMEAQLILSFPGNRWTNEQYRATTTTAQGIEFDGSALWTSLVWIGPGTSVAACGSAIVLKITYSACTKTHQFNSSIGGTS